MTLSWYYKEDDRTMNQQLNGKFSNPEKAGISLKFPEPQSDVGIEIIDKTRACVHQLNVGSISVRDTQVKAHEFNQVEFHHNAWFHYKKNIPIKIYIILIQLIWEIV